MASAAKPWTKGAKRPKAARKSVPPVPEPPSFGVQPAPVPPPPPLPVEVLRELENAYAREAKAREYDPAFCKIAERLYMIGATDIEVADFLGVKTGRLLNWAYEHEEFAAVRALGTAAQTDRVTRALYHRAIGYTHPEERIFCDKGLIVRAQTFKHYPPDVVAAVFWLTNRRRTDWQGAGATQPDTPELVSVDDLVRKLTQG